MTDVYRSFLLNLPIDCARRHFPPTALRPCSPSRRRELPSQTPPPPERVVGKSNADGATFSSNIHLFSLFLAALLSSNSSRVIFRRTISCFGFSQLLRAFRVSIQPTGTPDLFSISLLCTPSTFGLLGTLSRLVLRSTQGIPLSSPASISRTAAHIAT